MVDEQGEQVDDDAEAPADPSTGPEGHEGHEVGRHGVPETSSRGQTVLHPTRDQLVELVRALHVEGYHTCVDLTAVDRLRSPAHDLPAGVEPGRFELVVTLRDHGRRRRLRLRVQVPGDDATVPSLFPVHPGAEAFEREVFDLFGIAFDGHPDLTRILMPEDWIGHPLRKDQDSGRIPVQFKAPPISPVAP